MIKFSDFEKEILNEALLTNDDLGYFPVSDTIKEQLCKYHSKVIFERYSIIKESNKKEDIYVINVFVCKNSYAEERERNIASAKIIRLIHLFKKLYDENLITSPWLHFDDSCPLIIYYDEESKYLEKNGKGTWFSSKDGKEYDCYVFHGNKEIVDFYYRNKFVLVNESLLSYIRNDFKTDEEIKFEKQMCMMEAELEEAHNANKDAKESAEKQIELTQEALDKSSDANKIASRSSNRANAAVVVSVIFGLISAGLDFYATCVSTKIDPVQMDELRKSIEASKTVEVSNEKISVDANVNVDTITVKPVDAKKK